MKIKVIDMSEVGTLSTGETTVKHEQKLVSIVDDPHNIQFDHAEGHLMFFRLFRFPKKDVMRILIDEEGKEITITGAYIRACFKIQEVVPCFIVRYTVKEQVEKKGGGVLNCYTITEKERLFSMEAEKAEVIRLVEPYLIELDGANRKTVADEIRANFQEWAHPLTLEDVIVTLTEEQKLKAAKMLKTLFVA